MYRVWMALLPGFRWISWASFALGLVEVLVYGMFFGLVFAPLYNFFLDRGWKHAGSPLGNGGGRPFDSASQFARETSHEQALRFLRRQQHEPFDDTCREVMCRKGGAGKEPVRAVLLSPARDA